MSDFQISAVQRRRLLEGIYKPLVFQGVMDPDNERERLPYGCCVGARYVLAWKQAQATVLDEDTGEVAIMPKHPTWFITVTQVDGGPRKRRQLFDRPWVVSFSVTDIRDPNRFLGRIGGYDPDAPASFDQLQAGALPDPEWLEAHSKMIASFWTRRRVEQAAELQRERFRAKRLKRAA